ncbi:unnamed protein product [Darwinula stevensoni]|uniref:Casein kinase 1 gamma C-terminal domain-containing protein n=1 Tax=Darwinula stevensoni TaxID=69355 RepID=A0A7R9A2Z1_9CRUS|nr:unnamed protein product [Darwinula stevensoni]CAG0881020.1 unnamed protein product [Darwinula stevensoni]
MGCTLTLPLVLTYFDTQENSMPLLKEVGDLNFHLMGKGLSAVCSRGELDWSTPVGSTTTTAESVPLPRDRHPTSKDEESFGMELSSLAFRNMLDVVSSTVGDVQTDDPTGDHSNTPITQGPNETDRSIEESITYKGKIINRELVDELFELCSRGDFKLAHKLSPMHLHPSSTGKQRVYLAAQIL